MVWGSNRVVGLIEFVDYRELVALVGCRSFKG